jgi:hypothetical protein
MKQRSAEPGIGLAALGSISRPALVQVDLGVAVMQRDAALRPEALHLQAEHASAEIDRRG